MLDNYFTQYEKMIMPNKHSLRSLTKEQCKSSRKSSNSISRFEANISKNGNLNKKTNNTFMTNQEKEKITINLINDDLTCDNEICKNNELLDYKKANMFLRQELSTQKQKNQQLNNEISNLNNQINKYQEKEQKNADYILMLERVVDNLNDKMKKEKKPSTQKITNITPHQSTTNTISLGQKSELNLNNEIAIANKDEIVNKLLKENEKLKNFKKEIFSISETYNDINNSALIILKEILNHFNEINQFYEHISKEKINIDFDTEQSYYENIKCSTEQLLQLILKDNKIKNEEYKLLLHDKENELNEQININKEQSSLILELQSEIEEKDSNIIQLQNEVDMWKKASINKPPKKNFVDMNKKINKSKSALNMNNNLIKEEEDKINKKSRVDPKILKIQNSLNRSIKGIHKIYNTIDCKNPKF